MSAVDRTIFRGGDNNMVGHVFMAPRLYPSTNTCKQGFKAICMPTVYLAVFTAAHLSVTALLQGIIPPEIEISRFRFLR